MKPHKYLCCINDLYNLQLRGHSKLLQNLMLNIPNTNYLHIYVLILQTKINVHYYSNSSNPNYNNTYL